MFYTLLKKKVFDQLEHAQGPIYIIIFVEAFTCIYVWIYMKTVLKNSRSAQSFFLLSKVDEIKIKRNVSFFPPLLYLPFLSLLSIYLISFSSLGGL